MIPDPAICQQWEDRYLFALCSGQSDPSVRIRNAYADVVPRNAVHKLQCIFRDRGVRGNVAFVVAQCYHDRAQEGLESGL